MNGVSRHLRASSLPSLIRGYVGGINSVRRFSSQSDVFSGGRFREQGPVPGDSENNSGVRNTGRFGFPSDPNPSSPLRTFGDLKAGMLNRGGGNGFSAPNAPPTFKNPLRARLPNTLPDQFSQTNPGLSNTGGSRFSAPSYENFTQSSLLKENSPSEEKSSDMEFIREVISEDEGRRTSGVFSHFHRPNLETNADIIHIKMLQNNTFVTVTDSKGNIKLKATSGSLPDLKGGRKMTNYTADATAENIGRRAKAMGLKNVVVKVNGFTHFGKKRKAIIAFRDGFTNSRSDMNPIVYIEDTTRKAHNGCRLPRKRRV